MAGKEKPRIPRDIPGFNEYIGNTDDRQLAIDPVTSAAYYVGYGWTDAESEAWTAFREENDTWYELWDKKTTKRTTEVTDKLHANIKACVSYDIDSADGHGLLDLVALRGEQADWLLFNVKRQTTLQDTTKTSAASTEMKIPLLVILKAGHLYHQLLITNPDKPTSRAKPPGIKDVQVYTAIWVADGTEPPDTAYQDTGDASRGHAVISFLGADIKKAAWHKVRYENTKGERGEFCKPVSEIII